MSKEAMKLALEALEWINRVNALDFEYKRKARESLNAIYEALAEQPAPVAKPHEQEPFGYFRYDLRLDAWVQNREGRPGTAFYTSQPASKPWVGLTDEEVTWLCDTAKSHEQTWGMFVRAIEAKLKEKNT